MPQTSAVPARDAPGLTVADRNWIAHRHLKRCGWWAEALERSHGSRDAAAGLRRALDDVIREGRAEHLPPLYWWVRGRFAFGGDDDQ
jgi:hypothetical protein